MIAGGSRREFSKGYSSHGKKIIAGGSPRNFFRGYYSYGKNYYWRQPAINFRVLSSIFHTVKIIAGSSHRIFFWIILNMEKNHCWRQPAKLFRVLSSYGKKIITGSSRQKKIRGIFHMVTKLLLAAADKNF